MVQGREFVHLVGGAGISGSLLHKHQVYLVERLRTSQHRSEEMRLILLGGMLTTTLLSCGPSSTSTSPSTPAPPTVNIVAGARTLTAAAYTPNPIVIAPGMTVTWVNTDSTTHTSTADEEEWNSGPIAPGGRFSKTFQSASTFTYHCTIHPNMVGRVTVQ